MKMAIGNVHTHAILNKYEYIASQRQNAHLDGKLSYAEYLAAYNQYKRACTYYGETFCFAHILPPQTETIEEFNASMRPIWDIEVERRVRNRERDFAKAAGWTGEAYWLTADWHDLQAEQRKFEAGR